MKKYSKPIRYFLFIFLSGFIFSACDSVLETNTAPGTLQVLLTDAPGDYEAVMIDIREVRVHRSSDADDEESGWITISDERKKVDLLELTNGNKELLGEAELEPGTYSQIRLILGDENELVINGTSHHLTTPSAQQSGLKLNVNAEIESNSTYTLLLDFDASRSIVKAGNSGKYLLKPVIRTVNLAETGAIAGEIEPAEALPWVYAIAGEDTVAGTRASEEGEFLMIGIPSGTYQVSVVPADEDLFNRTVISNVEVTAPDTTFLDTISLEDAE
jgi:hypothetical protein